MTLLLLDHPELSVSSPAQGVVEIKLSNRKFQEADGSRKTNWSVGGFILILCFSFTWLKLESPKSSLYISFWSFITLFYLYSKSTQVLHESVLIIPRHGIQLETHRGLCIPLFPALQLMARRRFIPLTSVQDIVINEGLRRWDVRYYLCVIRDTGSEVTLEVVFENLLPHLPVLEVVYHRIHETLFRNS